MDPRRLIDEGSDFEAQLLDAGRRDVMPEPSRRALRASLGALPWFAAQSAAALGAKAMTAKAIWAVAAVGAVGALSVWAGSQFVEPASPAPLQAPHSQVHATESAAAVIVEAEPASSAPNSVDEPPSPPARRHSPALTPQGDTLALELEAVDSARSAVARGEYALALRLLDQYATRFPKPHLGAEATLLRIEAHAARGERAAAERLGRAFLARQPNSPYARRVRSLISEAASAEPAP